MAQSQLHHVNQVHNTFNIYVDEMHSIKIYKKLDNIMVGVYRIDKKGVRRGISLPLDVWYKMTTTSNKEIVDLAINLVNGSVFSSFDPYETNEIDHGQYSL